MTALHIPGATVRCRRASFSGSSRATAYREDTEMRIRHLAAAAAAALAVTAPADAHHVTKAEVKALIVDTFGPTAGPHALRIAACESDFVHTARHRNRNGTTDYGVFQLNSGGTLQSLGLTPASALDPVVNVKAAYRLYRRRGWQPWVCSRGRQ